VNNQVAILRAVFLQYCIYHCRNTNQASLLLSFQSKFWVVSLNRMVSVCPKCIKHQCSFLPWTNHCSSCYHRRIRVSFHLKIYPYLTYGSFVFPNSEREVKEPNVNHGLRLGHLTVFAYPPCNSRSVLNPGCDSSGS
jgi:hypothetical protein